MGAITDGADPQFHIVGICHRCLHRRGIRTCDAFPDGIPFEILGGSFIHTDPFPGDNGIQFEAVIQ